MALGITEIRSRATTFAHYWRNATSEQGDTHTFWNEFFEVFGISRKRVATFEFNVKKLGERRGRIDMFWPGVLLIEQKSAGESLEKAFSQALDYFPGIEEHELPRFILVCDFARFHLYDLIDATDIIFPLAELPARVEAFGFMTGVVWNKPPENEKVSLAAAEKMEKLYQKMMSINYTGRKLKQYLVRLLFCLFADDTSIFSKNAFTELIAETKPDGSDLARTLADLFERLNTDEKDRLKIEDRLSAFPYINGDLFAEVLPMAAFDAEMRKLLLDSCAFDWGFITPSIFGSMFQAAMDEDERSELGAHYTEESNILKAINPLFMDALNAEYEEMKSNPRKLKSFHDKLANLRFLDPACGTANFLIIAYRELRRLEIKVLESLLSSKSTDGTFQMTLDVTAYSKINVDQFYGIEVDELACEIARVGMWLMDHQCNMELSKALGEYYVRLPLTKAAVIFHANALTIDWNEICPAHELEYILGNPPFYGARLMTKEQKADLIAVVIDPAGKPVKGSGNLDFVSAWYYKSAQLMVRNPKIRAALVSTNSITQGEQTAIVWKTLMEEYKVKIDFAYRTFVWTSAARGKAAVHCVIVGFSHERLQTSRRIFDGDLEIDAENINPYLVAALNVFIENRKKALCDVPQMNYGTFALDDGNYTIPYAEYLEIVSTDPHAVTFLRPFIGARELLHNEKRFCVWLRGAKPSEIIKSTVIKQKIGAVKEWRSKSNRGTTAALADTPTLFAEMRQPNSTYLAIPTASSEIRKYIPIAYLSPDIIASNQLYIIPDATLYHFGILTSEVHMAWVRTVCGRIKSDFRYSASIVYNNFPWPNPTEKQKQAVEVAAQGILNARNIFPNESLAILYGSKTMPPELAKAHRALDTAVKKAYGGKGFASEAERVADLMERYQALIKGEK